MELRISVSLQMRGRLSYQEVAPTANITPACAYTMYCLYHVCYTYACLLCNQITFWKIIWGLHFSEPGNGAYDQWWWWWWFSGGSVVVVQWWWWWWRWWFSGSVVVVVVLLLRLDRRARVFRLMLA